MPKQPKSWRDVIAVHPAADLFPMMTADELKALGEDIKENGLTQQIVLWTPDSNYRKWSKSHGMRKPKRGEFYLLEGRNRVDALVSLDWISFDEDDGWPNISGYMLKLDADQPTIFGPEVDPYRYVLSANVLRRHLTAEQKRDLIAAVLKAQPEKSNREIARQVKDDHHKVGAVRRKLEATGEVSPVEKTTGADGKARTTAPTRKPKRRDIDDPAEKKARLAGKDADAPASALADLSERIAYAETAAIADDGNGRMTVTIGDGWREPLAKSAEYLGVPADEYAEFLMQLGQRTFNSKFQSMRAPAAHGLSNDIAWWLIEMHSKYPDTFNVGSWEGSCGHLAIDKLYAERGVPIGKFREWQQAERNKRHEAKRDAAKAPAGPPVGDELDIPPCLKRT